MAARAGHDLNYIVLSGVLSGIGRAGEAPVPPLNQVGDYCGGGMLLALGVVAALLSVQRGGQGQVVDAVMIEGAAQLGAVVRGLLASGHWNEQRESNLLDGGTLWCDSYRTPRRAFLRRLRKSARLRPYAANADSTPCAIGVSTIKRSHACAKAAWVLSASFSQARRKQKARGDAGFSSSGARASCY